MPFSPEFGSINLKAHTLSLNGCSFQHVSWLGSEAMNVQQDFLSSNEQRSKNYAVKKSDVRYRAINCQQLVFCYHSYSEIRMVDDLVLMLVDLAQADG